MPDVFPSSAVKNCRYKKKAPSGHVTTGTITRCNPKGELLHLHCREDVKTLIVFHKQSLWWRCGGQVRIYLPDGAEVYIFGVGQ